ncbi:hypothetical protein B296_00036701, partial [Ensete ventricosum]
SDGCDGAVEKGSLQPPDLDLRNLYLLPFAPPTRLVIGKKQSGSHRGPHPTGTNHSAVQQGITRSVDSSINKGVDRRERGRARGCSRYYSLQSASKGEEDFCFSSWSVSVAFRSAAALFVLSLLL